MSRPISLVVGDVYGLLKIKALAMCDKNRTRYLCDCACGNETITEARSIKNGKTRSCGCLRTMIGLAHVAYPYTDLIGVRFDRLLVLEYSYEHLGVKRNSHVICKCDCGVEKIVSTYNLKSGNVKSCGCKHEEFKEMFRKKRKDYEPIANRS